MPRKKSTKVILNSKDYIWVGEASEILGVCKETLRNWDKNGKLKSYRHSMSKFRLYKKEDIYTLLDGIIKEK